MRNFTVAAEMRCGDMQYTKNLQVPADSSIVEICQIVRDRLDNDETEVDYIHIPQGDFGPATGINSGEYHAYIGRAASQRARPLTPPPEYAEIDPYKSSRSERSSNSDASSRYYPASIASSSRQHNAPQMQMQLHSGRPAVRPDRQVRHWQPSLAPIDENGYAIHRQNISAERRPMHEVLWSNLRQEPSNVRMYEEWSSHEVSEVVRRYRYHERHSRRRH